MHFFHYRYDLKKEMDEVGKRPPKPMLVLNRNLTKEDLLTQSAYTSPMFYQYMQKGKKLAEDESINDPEFIELGKY